MFIQDNIAKDFPCFEVGVLASEALSEVRGFDFSHIFVENENYFQGAILKEFLEQNETKTLGELLYFAEKFFISEDNTMLDSLKLFNIFNANIIPVLNDKEEYQGYISWDNVVGELSKYPFFSEVGALLTVEIPRENYSMTEISQIVEGNNAKFYGAFISEMNEAMLRVTMRISHENLSSIDETFERYGYTIVQKFYSDEKEELLKSRYQFMQKYLEI